MGQRLNIEIHSEGEVLANAYYHWSAYTSSALELAMTIVSQVDNLVDETDPVIKAVRLLEMTGAGVTGNDDLKVVTDRAPNKTFARATSRNEGLIATTEAGIDETRQWAEGEVIIDIGARNVRFFVLHTDTE